MRLGSWVLHTWIALLPTFARGAPQEPPGEAKPFPDRSWTPPWQERFDFDGDGQPDRIDVTFSGGAHCCYTLALHLTRTGRVLRLPFWMDGGYIGGLSLSHKKHFDIVIRGTRFGPETVLLMEVATYSGRAERIPRHWRVRYGVHSHAIAVHLDRAGRLRIENLAWQEPG